jgi:hypothetical protein
VVDNGINAEVAEDAESYGVIIIKSVLCVLRVQTAYRVIIDPVSETSDYIRMTIDSLLFDTFRLPLPNLSYRDRTSGWVCPYNTYT